MSCTCPYAADGNRCKHMAAVLYQIEDLGGFYEQDPLPVDMDLDAEATAIDRELFEDSLAHHRSGFIGI